MANDIEVRVGAVLDRSFDVVMGDVQSKADRAQRAQSRRAGGSAGGGDMYGPGRREFAKSLAYNEAQQRSSERRQEREHDKSERQKTASTLREAKRRVAADSALQRQRASALASQHSAEERAQAKHENALARARSTASRRSEREADRFANRTSHRATRFFFPPPEGALGFAKRTAHDLLRGAGVDFNTGASVARNVANESAATKLSNQGWNPNEIAWEKRIKAGDIRKSSQAMGSKLGYSEEDITSGMQEYTNLTGDLKGAIELMPKLALLAKATGTDLADMGKAAADMGVQLENVPDKAEVLQKVLGIAALQGKTGALEMFQLAPQMPRIVSLASQFQGDRGENISSLLASTQLIRRYGGVGTAPQAATALAGAVASLNQKGGAKFAKYGIKTANDKGELRSLEDISIDTITKSTQNGKFNRKMFFDMWNAVRGGKLATGLLGVYNEAGGGDKGVAAIHEKYAKFKAPLVEEAQAKLAAAASDTTESRAQRFTTALDRVTQGMQDKLLPVLERLEGPALHLVEVFKTLVVWAAENPFQAVVVAMTASVARAGIESGIRLILDRAAQSFMGGAGPGIGGMGGSASVGAMFAGKGIVGGMATGVGVAVSLAAIGAAAYETTYALLELRDHMNAVANEKQRKTQEQTWFDEAAKVDAAKGPLAKQTAASEAIKKIEELGEKSHLNTTTGEYEYDDNTKAHVAAINKKVTDAADEGTAQQRNARTLESAGVGFKAQQGEGITDASIARALVQALTGAPIYVRVNNFDEMPNMTYVSGGDSNKAPPRYGVLK